MVAHGGSTVFHNLRFRPGSFVDESPTKVEADVFKNLHSGWPADTDIFPLVASLQATTGNTSASPGNTLASVIEKMGFWYPKTPEV